MRLYTWKVCTRCRKRNSEEQESLVTRQAGRRRVGRVWEQGGRPNMYFIAWTLPIHGIGLAGLTSKLVSSEQTVTNSTFSSDFLGSLNEFPGKCLASGCKQDQFSASYLIANQLLSEPVFATRIAVGSSLIQRHPNMAGDSPMKLHWITNSKLSDSPSGPTVCCFDCIKVSLLSIAIQWFSVIVNCIRSFYSFCRPELGPFGYNACGWDQWHL